MMMMLTAMLSVEFDVGSSSRRGWFDVYEHGASAESCASLVICVMKTFDFSAQVLQYRYGSSMVSIP